MSLLLLCHLYDSKPSDVEASQGCYVHGRKWASGSFLALEANTVVFQHLKDPSHSQHQRSASSLLPMLSLTTVCYASYARVLHSGQWLSQLNLDCNAALSLCCLALSTSHLWPVVWCDTKPFKDADGDRGVLTRQPRMQLTTIRAV